MRLFFCRQLFVFGILAGLLILPAHASAVSGEKDLQVVMKALLFQDPPQKGTIPFAVIFDPASPISKQEAETIYTAATQATSRSVILQPVLVSFTDLHTINAPIAYLSTGTAEASFQTLSQKGILSVSASDDCIKTAHCVLSVKSEPSVEIKINSLAAQRSNIRFQSAFRMMVQEY